MKSLILAGVAAAAAFFGYRGYEKKLSNDEWRELATKSPGVAALVNNMLTGQQITPGGLGDRQLANVTVAQLATDYPHLAARLKREAPALQV